MARVTVEDCIEKIGNRFALVILAGQRARQLARGSEPLVESTNRPAVTALREIAAGRVYFVEDIEKIVREFIEEQRADGLL